MTREEAAEILFALAGNSIWEDEFEAFNMALKALQERPKGRWKHGNCTECGLYVGETTCRHYSYCPNCGADMRGKEDG